MAENFGDYLKHERELRGVPLQEIADNTKIPMRFLQALEESSLDDLPGEVFIKGFIRSYAKSIGTDADEILTAFNKFAGQALENERKQQLAREIDSLEERRRKNRKTALWVLVSIIILLGSGYLARLATDQNKPFTPESEKPTEAFDLSPAAPNSPSREFSAKLDTEEENSGPSSTNSYSLSESLSEEESGNNGEPSPSPEAEPAGLAPDESAIANPESDSENVNKPDTPEKDVELVRKDDMISPAQKTPINNAKPLELTIQVKEQSWFELLIDDTRIEDFILPGGTGKTFRGKESFKITIGNRYGTRLLLNGRPLVLPASFPTEKDVVRDFLIQAELLE